MLNSEPTDIESLPTLLDVLNQIAYDEVNWNMRDDVLRQSFPSYHDKGRFTAVEMPTGEVRLEPCGQFAFRVYRGQTSYYKECKPSLYRDDMTDSKVFLERLKLKELELLIDKHPLTDICKNGLSWLTPDGSYRQLSLAIDHLGLAQHYGIKTELMDLTNDKWVAAFFACSDYVGGKYVTHKAKDGEYGVFYSMVPCKYYIVDPKGYETFRAIGQQPFPRPGEQSGFTLKLNRDQNFNDEAEKIFFRHDDRVSELIFNYANRSDKYFPYDIFQEKALLIINSKSFSNLAFQNAVKEFYPDDSSVIETYVRDEGISFQDASVVEFTKKEIADFCEEWPNREKEYLSKIIIRPVYKGPIEFVNGADIR